MSRAVLKLEDAGFDRRQVEALIDFIDGDRVTKADLLATENKLERRIDQVEAKLSARIEQVEAKLSARIEQVEAKLSARMDQLEAKLAALETKFEGKFTLLQWMFGVLIALNVAILIKVLFG